MVDSLLHKPSSPKITPKEEPVTLDKLESPNPFLPAYQVEFIFEEIAFTTNNEVALLYPLHPNSEYFREVSDFISKCSLKEAYIKAPTQYKEYLGEFWYTAKTLDDSKIWVSTPTRGIRGDIVRPWFTNIDYIGEIRAKRTLKKSCFPPRWRPLMGQVIQCLDYAMLIWEDIFHKLSKKTREKVVPYPRFISLLLEYMMPKYENKELTINLTQVFSVHNWALKPNQTEGPPFTDHMKAICNLDVPVDPKAPKPSQTEEVPQGKKPGAKSRLRRKQSSKHISESKTEASKSKTGQSKKETQSSLAKDKSPSHPSPPTSVVGEMHKEAQQAAGGPTSLRATSEDGAHPQLNSGHDASADSTDEADPGLSTPNDSLPSQQDQTKSARDGLKTAQTDSGTNESKAYEISKKIKLEDLSDLLKDTRSAFFTPDSPQDEPIIVLDESKEEEEVAKDKDTHASSHDVPEDTSIPHPPSPKSAQLQELMAQVQLLQSQKDELEQQKAQAEAEVTSLKARPSYPDVNQLTTLLVTSLKSELSKLLASHNFASCLPTELKEFPSKFTELSREIKELKKHVKDMKIKLPRDLKEIPTKLETFTSTISSLTSQVAELKNIQWELPEELQPLAVLVSSVQKYLKTLDSLPNLLNKVTETLNRFASVDLLGIDVVEQYHKKKLLFDKYCDKMLKRRKSSKIINYDVIIQKGPIPLKVYRENETIEVIANLKVSDLHLAE
ncbi:hypothetical protein Tco_0461131 [Tanacetum coccineum]